MCRIFAREASNLRKFLQRELASQAYHSAGQCWPKVSDVCARAPWERERVGRRMRVDVARTTLLVGCWGPACVLRCRRSRRWFGLHAQFTVAEQHLF